MQSGDGGSIPPGSTTIPHHNLENMMKLHDLSPDAQHILRTLYFSGAGMRRSELGEQTGLTLDQISPHLSRLKAKGWLETEVTHDGSGALWRLTEVGQSLLPYGDKSEPEPEPEPEEPIEPDFPTKLEYVPDGADAAVAVQLLDAMEVEVALDRLRHQQRFKLIPAQTARVYREVVAALPTVLREALEPLTEWLEAAP